MFRNLAPLTGLFVILALALPAQAGPQWAMGAGFEARVQREVNPDYAELKALGQLFAQMHLDPWVAHAELSEEKRETKSGALSIAAHSRNFGLWGRYQFLPQKRLRPFAGLGFGTYFDRVISSFSTGARDERAGLRPYWGGGGGVSVILWEHLLLEGEGRATLVRDRKEPMVAALLRVGFFF